jgi:hypothetical protein
MRTSTRIKRAVVTCLLGTMGLVSFGQVITIGSGSTTTSSMVDSPYGTYYMDDRTQFLYTASEIVAAGGYAGFITNLAFNVAANASMSMNAFTISIGTTNATSIASGYASTTLTPVYTSNVTTSTGWNTYNFSAPYFWNGTSSLVVDVCFDNSAWASPSGTVYADYTPNMVYGLYNDISSGSLCGTTQGYGGTGYYRAQTRLTILPPYANDAGIAAIINPSLPTCDLDSVDITVLLTNAGSDTLNTCTIKWQIGSGTPTSFSYTGSVNPQGGTDTVVLANHSFSNFDLLTIWTENPNGQNDSLPGNDTASMVLATGLAGTYSIPGDFATITLAAAALNTFGVCDDVTMEIATGTYTEQVILGPVLGAGEDAQVTFTSATGNAGDVMINYTSIGSTDNHVVYLNGSDWITFSDVSIRNNSTGTYATAVRLENGAEHNTFDGCHIKAGPYGYTGNLLTAVYSSGMNHHFTLTNNRIEKGGYGIYVYGNGTSAKVENVVIENNMIEDAYYMQNYLLYIDGLEFNNNVVTNDSNIYAIPYGVYMYYVDDFNFTGNYVGSNQSYLNSSLYGGYGYTVYMYSCIGTSNPRGQFTNNCINAGKAGASYYGYYGVYMSQCGLIDFHHNTVTRHGGYTGYYTTYINGGGAISVKNNSFVDYMSGYAMYAPGVWTITESDNNNFYTTSGALVYFGSTQYSTLSAYQEGEGYDLNSVSTDPAFADTLLCITCNDTLNNAGTPTTLSDISGNVRSLVTPDIGAVEWVSPTTFTLGGDSTYCADEVVVEAGPAQSVTWSVNGNSSNAPSITLQAGNQTTTFNVLVSITTQYCGSASDNALITLVPNAHLDSTTHICADASATLSPGGSTSGSYTWSTGATTQSIVVDAPGMYTVTKDVLGCVSSASTIVTQSEAVQIIGTEVCIDDLPLSLDATIANGTSYAWSGGASPGTAVNTFTTGGPYTVTASDSYGCSSVDSFEVVILEEPSAVIGILSTSGTIYVFDATSSSFLTSTSSVTWSFGAGAVPSTSNNVTETVTYPWPNPSNPASYSVSLEINNGCGIDITTQIVTPDPLSVEELGVGEFSIFPNPAQDQVTIATKEVAAGSIMILDMSGRVVAELPMAAGSNNHVIEVSDLASGTYTVKVMNDSSTQMKQLIVQ